MKTPLTLAVVTAIFATAINDVIAGYSQLTETSARSSVVARQPNLLIP